MTSNDQPAEKTTQGSWTKFVEPFKRPTEADQPAETPAIDDDLLRAIARVAWRQFQRDLTGYDGIDGAALVESEPFQRLRAAWTAEVRAELAASEAEASSATELLIAADLRSADHWQQRALTAERERDEARAHLAERREAAEYFGFHYQEQQAKTRAAEAEVERLRAELAEVYAANEAVNDDRDALRAENLRLRAAQPLPDVTPRLTPRGFAMWMDEPDLNGERFSVQQSSLATEAALWVGQGNDRSHLSVEQVRKAAACFHAFLDAEAAGAGATTDDEQGSPTWADVREAHRRGFDAAMRSSRGQAALTDAEHRARSGQDGSAR